MKRHLISAVLVASLLFSSATVANTSTPKLTPAQINRIDTEVLRNLPFTQRLRLMGTCNSRNICRCTESSDQVRQALGRYVGVVYHFCQLNGGW